jgi:SAM-dependent methyltransferase
MFQQIMNAVPVPHERALDLGGGTGLSAVPLTRWFNQVVVVEPDPQMAVRLYGLSDKMVVREEKAEDLEERPGSFDLVTSGNAFYWMQGEVVINKIVAWLRSGGVLAVYRYGFPSVAGPIDEILQKELKEKWDAFRHPRLIHEEYSTSIIKSCSALTNVRIVTVPNIVPLWAEQLVGFLKSTSYCAAYLRTLSSPESYLADLETSIRSVPRDSPIDVDFKLELILAQRA